MFGQVFCNRWRLTYISHQDPENDCTQGVSSANPIHWLADSVIVLNAFPVFARTGNVSVATAPASRSRLQWLRATLQCS